MKKVMTIVLMAVMTLGMAACGGGDKATASKHDSPSDVVKKYLDLVVAQQYEEAVMLYDGVEGATQEEIKGVADLIAFAMEMNGGLERYEILGEEIDETGDNATVKLKYLFKGEGEKETDGKLVKKEGVWRLMMN